MTRKDFVNLVDISIHLAKRVGFNDEIFAIVASGLGDSYENFNKEKFVNECYKKWEGRNKEYSPPQTKVGAGKHSINT